MRIIAGMHRGRRLSAPEGRATRPMLDRVREAVFSTLMPRLPGADVLDLFAGTGSLGLEALSRGARRVRFVEQGAEALGHLRANVATLGVEAQVEILARDALAPASWMPANLIFLDPPYALVAEQPDRVLSALRELLGPSSRDEAMVVLHVARGAIGADALTDVDARVRTYGTNDIWYVTRAASRPD